MFFIPTLLQGAGAALGAIGQLSGANSQEQMGAINEQIAISNAATEQSETLTRLELDSARGKIELDASKTNLRLALADVGARNRNAERLRLFAESKTKQSREAIRRQMKSFEEFQSSQSAAVGSSGAVMSGSAMEVILASAEQFRTQIQDMHDEASFERSNNMDASRLEQYGAQRDAMGARAQFNSAKQGNTLGKAANRIGKINAKTAFQSAVLSAQVEKMSADDAAGGQKMGAVGSILGAMGGMI